MDINRRFFIEAAFFASAIAAAQSVLPAPTLRLVPSSEEVESELDSRTREYAKHSLKLSKPADFDDVSHYTNFINSMSLRMRVLKGRIPETIRKISPPDCIPTEISMSEKTKFYIVKFGEPQLFNTCVYSADGAYSVDAVTITTGAINNWCQLLLEETLAHEVSHQVLKEDMSGRLINIPGLQPSSKLYKNEFDRFTGPCIIPPWMHDVNMIHALLKITLDEKIARQAIYHDEALASRMQCLLSRRSSAAFELCEAIADYNHQNAIDCNVRNEAVDKMILLGDDPHPSYEVNRAEIKLAFDDMLRWGIAQEPPPPAVLKRKIFSVYHPSVL
jgi:hypothetical protein